MLNTGTNKKLYIIIIILAITNISTIATIFFHSHRAKHEFEMQNSGRKKFDREKAGEFLKKELDLTPTRKRI